MFLHSSCGWLRLPWWHRPAMCVCTESVHVVLLLSDWSCSGPTIHFGPWKSCSLIGCVKSCSWSATSRQLVSDLLTLSGPVMGVQLAACASLLLALTPLSSPPFSFLFLPSSFFFFTPRPFVLPSLFIDSLLELLCNMTPLLPSHAGQMTWHRLCQHRHTNRPQLPTPGLHYPECSSTLHIDLANTIHLLYFVTVTQSLLPRVVPFCHYTKPCVTFHQFVQSYEWFNHFNTNFNLLHPGQCVTISCWPIEGVW